MAHPFALLISACVFGFFMAWGTGANDVANAVGTSVGSKALTVLQAVIIAAIFEAAGGLLASGNVTQTIRSGIIDSHLFIAHSDYIVYGMLAALLSSAIWLALASYFKWPVSTTHSIIGAIIGFALIDFGPQTIHWHVVTNIALSWIVTPVIAGFIGHLIYRSIQMLILHTDDPFFFAKRFVPIYIFLVAFIISLVTLTKGLAHLQLNYSTFQHVEFSLSIAIFVLLIGMWLLKHIKQPVVDDVTVYYMRVQKIFATLMVFTACAMAFAHGSNDLANAIGPIAAIDGIIRHPDTFSHALHIPEWIVLLGVGGIITGLLTYGYRVIGTIGDRITQLTPSRGFAAQLATASTIMVASGLGLPVSTTQTLVGAVLGVGFAKGIKAVNKKAVRDIFLSWVITLPVSAILAAIIYYILKGLLGS